MLLIHVNPSHWAGVLSEVHCTNDFETDKNNTT